MLQPICRALSFSPVKVFRLKMGVIGPLVLACCFVCLCGAAPIQAQESFENGFPPPAWTFNGHPALGGVADGTSGIAPTDGMFFGWISTGCSFSAGTTCPDVATAGTPSYASLGLSNVNTVMLGSPTTETVLISPSFTFSSTTTISFDVNFITTDGTTGFADFALVQLVPSGDSSPINLFVANTTDAASAAVPPVDLNAGVGSMSPSTVSFLGTTVTLKIDNNSADNTVYGNVAKFGGGLGGPTGWVHVTYSALAGTYTLKFLVSHVGDIQYPSALAIDHIVGPSFVTTPVVTDGTAPTTVVFNPTPGQLVEHDLIFPATGDLMFPITNPLLKVTNRLISNSTGWPPYVIGTPFAISKLFVHEGDSATNGSTDTDTGSMYVDECFNSTNAPSEPNCPVPNTGKHIISKDIFDIAPPKPAIAFGTTASFIHYYPNTISTITTWSPSSTSPNPVCTTVTGTSATPSSASKCDTRDILVDIFGDQGGMTGKDGRKGTFTAVYSVPMLLSTVSVNGTQVNTPGVQPSTPPPPPFFRSPLTFDFNVQPAQLPTGFTTQNFTSITRSSGTVTVTMSSVPAAWVDGTLLMVNPSDTADFPPICAVISNVMMTTFQYAQPLPDASSGAGGSATSGANCWVAAPVSNLYYTFNFLSSNPPALPDIPDMPTCPATGSCTVTSVTQPGASSTSNVEFTSTPTAFVDGQYLLQWSAADNVGIRERNDQLITIPPAPAGTTCPNPDAPGSPTPAPCYQTTLFSSQINVDTTAPSVSAPVLSPPPVNGSYTLGQAGVTASVTCIDPVVNMVASGVMTCGNLSFTPAPTPPATSQTSVAAPTVPVTISAAPGSQTITVTAKDGAGNVGTSPGVPICVGVGYTVTSVDRNGIVGFTAPVDNPGPGPVFVVNQINSKQAVPLQLTVQDCNGNPITNLDLVGGTGVGTAKTVVLTVANAPANTCKVAVVDNSLTAIAAGGSGWQNFLNGVYTYNWRSGAPVGSCLAFSVNLGDGTQHTAYFQVIK